MQALDQPKLDYLKSSEATWTMQQNSPLKLKKEEGEQSAYRQIEMDSWAHLVNCKNKALSFATR